MTVLQCITMYWTKNVGVPPPLSIIHTLFPVTLRTLSRSSKSTWQMFTIHLSQVSGQELHGPQTLPWWLQAKWGIVVFLPLYLIQTPMVSIINIGYDCLQVHIRYKSPTHSFWPPSLTQWLEHSGVQYSMTEWWSIWPSCPQAMLPGRG